MPPHPQFKDFKSAVEFIRDKSFKAKGSVPNERKLALYSLYKQATEGDVKGSQPWSVQFEARAKWDAWNGRKGLSKEAAEKAYVDEVNKQIKEIGFEKVSA